MVTVIGSINENFSPVIKRFPVVSTAMRKGAVVTKAAGSTGLALYTTPTAIAAWGVTNHAVASSATAVADITTIVNGTILEIDVAEILAGTALVATGGSTTTIADTSLENQPDDTLIGSVVEVVTCAASAALIGTKLTITDYTAAGGTLTFATAAAAMAGSDTYKFLSVNGTRMAGHYTAPLDVTYADSINLDNSGTSADGNGAGDWCRVIGTNAAGTKLIVVVTAGIDSMSALTV